MRNRLRNNFLPGLLCLFLLVLSGWLQFGTLGTLQTAENKLDKNQPDYYMENFVTVGKNNEGIKYKLSADKLTHYPQDDRSLLDNPSIFKYSSKKGAMQVNADSGWLYNDRSTVKLEGDVRIVEGRDTSTSSTINTNNMFIQLK